VVGEGIEPPQPETFGLQPSELTYVQSHREKNGLLTRNRSECDLLYVLSEVDDVTRRHLIPTAVIQCTNQLNLGKKYAAYELQPAPTNR
jgi:hypothetical protein